MSEKSSLPMVKREDDVTCNDTYTNNICIIAEHTTAATPVKNTMNLGIAFGDLIDQAPMRETRHLMDLDEHMNLHCDLHSHKEKYNILQETMQRESVFLIRARLGKC